MPTDAISYDYDIITWRNHRTRILSKIYQFCKAHSLPIIGKHSFNNVPIHIKKIVYIRIGDLIETYKDWEEFNNLCIAQQRTVYVVTDNFCNYRDLSNIKFFIFSELNGVFAVETNITTRLSKSRLFNCFINRVESVRQSWFYFLYHYNLLDQGYVSFLLDNLPTYSPYTGAELFDYIHTQYKLNELPHFEKAYHALKSQVPYQNFNEIQDLLPYVRDSKYSLVLETVATDPITDNWHYSEKIFRMLQEPTIPLIFAQAKGISLLKSLGFEIYADHTHIDNLTWHERQQQLLNILIEDPIEYNQSRAIEICLHNRQVTLDMLLCASGDNYFDKFFNAVLEN